MKIITPTDSCLVNPFHHVEEDDLDRLQTDVPRNTKFYLTGLFGARGAVQKIINTVFFHLEHECKSLGLSGYDPTNDATVAAILNQLVGAGRRVRDSQVGLGPLNDCETYALVGSLVGPNPSSSDRQPTPLPASNPTPPNNVGGGDAQHDHGTPSDANRHSNSKRQSGGRSRATGSKDAVPRKGSKTT